MEVYVDDMLVKSRKSEGHIEDLEEAFGVIRANGMKLNSAKCFFGLRSDKFLCYMVIQRGIEVNPAKVQMVLDMQPPTNLRELTEGSQL